LLNIVHELIERIISKHEKLLPYILYMISIKNYYRQYSIHANKNLVTNILLLAGLTLILVLLGLKFNMTSNPIIGDEASFTLQALSIVNDFDLKFEEHDGKYWRELDWSEHPYGLFFQKYKGGYAFAKPYGYSLFLAPFIILFGMSGFTFGNTFILGLVTLFTFLTLRSFYGKLESLLLTVSFTFFSYVYIYVFYITPDLFLAMLGSMFVFFLTKLSFNPNKVYFTSLALITAFMISEKIIVMLVILPMLLFYFYKSGSFRKVVSLCLIFLAGFLLFILPYLHYSDYRKPPYRPIR